ncbi:DUF1444 domain-containing protein [Amphibacillus sediminis]|uniref:DUF1444 domain-containing protein n=1 Tax=Amphibacillus sediminis TaxID=360185 RepID=UPI000830DD83|nr:DUF1444 domain-containing protein [Amphibacillus sediminis]
MALTTLKLKKILDKHFSQSEWQTSFNREQDSYRVEWRQTKKGVTIKLPSVLAKHEQRGEAAIEELVYHVKTSLKMMNEEQSLQGNEQKIFPVIRSTSFPTATNSGKALIYQDHTAETRIYYALDLGDTYQLIDESLLATTGWSRAHLHEMALFNMKSLPINLKEDEVAGNQFYFVSAQDGYDASRLLNESWLDQMADQAKGELAIAVPHQDVLIVVDVRNEMGYDILAQMAMQFFAEGRVPITALSFIYQDRHLEPVFILAKKKPMNQNENEDE